jgi:hypothetical protein
VKLPASYSVTPMGCCKALKRALNREPAQAVEEYRAVDNQRLEDWLLSLAARIRSGDIDAVKTGLALLKHRADLNGYAAVVDKPSSVLNQTLIIQQTTKQ